MRRILKKVTAFLMLLLTLQLGFNYNLDGSISGITIRNEVVAYSENAGNIEQPGEIQGQAEKQDKMQVEKKKPVKVRELTDKRKVNTKYFLNNDGSTTAEIYQEPIYYKNKNGKLEDIDLTISPRENDKYLYSSEKNSFKSYFGDKTDTQNPVLAGVEALNSKGAARWINYKLVGAAPGKNYSEGSKFRFDKVFDGVDLEYVTTPTKLKENIVLNKPGKKNQFTFILDKSEGIRLEQRKNDILLIDEDTLELLWKIEVPFATDAELNRTYELSYTLGETQHKGKKCDTITVSFDDTKWLETAVYPVTIDPTTTYNLAAGNASEIYGYSGYNDPTSG
jgi:hypothetical protein